MNKILLIVALCLSSITFAQNRTIPYDFPIKPGTEEWKKLKSRTEMADELQIPTTILKDLTTEALAITCLNFPMFKDLYFFNSVQTGFNGLKQSFNGFQELLARSDAGTELFKLYKQMNPEEVNSLKNDILKGDFTFKFVQIEILLAQDQIVNALSPNIENELLKEASGKYESKKTTTLFSGFSLSPSILLIGRILDKGNKLQNIKADFPNDSIENFLSTGLVGNPEILDRIWQLTKK